MTLNGPCVTCGAPLASDQHHCVICGHVVTAHVPAAAQGGADGILLRRRGIPLPPQTAILASILAIGFGGVIGSTIGPGLETVFAASTSAPQVVKDETLTANAGSNGGGSTSGTGGAEPAATPAPVAPAATTPVTTPPPVTPVAPVAPVEDPPATDEPTDPVPIPPDESTPIEGTVVRVNPEAGSYSLASGGALSTIHAKVLPKPGADVSVSVEDLFNGTLGEVGKRKESAGPEKATFSGTVTFVDEEALLYVLSSPGASIPVRVPAPAGGAAPDMPKLSAAVTVDVEIGPAPDPPPPAPTVVQRVDVPPPVVPPVVVPPPVVPAPTDPAPTDPAPQPAGCVPEAASPPKPVDPVIELTQTSLQVDFESLSSTGLEGIVQAVCPDLDQIVISADDLRELGQDLTLTIPKDVDPTKVAPGDSITTSVDPTPADDGTLALTGLAGDDGLKDADDKKQGQGDKQG